MAPVLLYAIGGWRASNGGVAQMCDYSLHNVVSRPAKVGDATRETSVQVRADSLPRKMLKSPFAFCREPNWHSPTG